MLFVGASFHREGKLQPAMNQKLPRQLRTFAQAVSKGQSLKDAMLVAGYAESTASRGRASLSKPMLDALAKQGAQLEYLGGAVSPEQQEKIARGRLLLNALRGKDEGVQSAKLLGPTCWDVEAGLAGGAGGVAGTRGEKDQPSRALAALEVCRRG